MNLRASVNSLSFALAVRCSESVEVTVVSTNDRKCSLISSLVSARFLPSTNNNYCSKSILNSQIKKLI